MQGTFFYAKSTKSCLEPRKPTSAAYLLAVQWQMQLLCRLICKSSRQRMHGCSEASGCCPSPLNFAALVQGHFQIMFSKQHCPLNQPRLSFFMKLMFCSGVWSYIVGAVSTPTFIVIPIITIWFGVFPIVVSFWAALGLTVYFIATQR